LRPRGRWRLIMSACPGPGHRAGRLQRDGTVVATAKKAAGVGHGRRDSPQVHLAREPPSIAPSPRAAAQPRCVGDRYAERMPEELIVTPDLAMPPSEPQWRCPIPGCDLEVLYPEELEFHADRTHPDWAVRRVAARGLRRREERWSTSGCRMAAPGNTVRTGQRRCRCRDRGTGRGPPKPRPRRAAGGSSGGGSLMVAC